MVFAASHAKQSALGLARNEEHVSECNDMSTCKLVLQEAEAIEKIQ